jgi:hypothetical protein
VVARRPGAEAPDRPLRVLYLGAVEAGVGGPGGGGSRTNYAYLPGQTLAPRRSTSITSPIPPISRRRTSAISTWCAGDERLRSSIRQPGGGSRTSRKAGRGWIQYADGRRPSDAVLREAVLGAVSRKRDPRGRRRLRPVLRCNVCRARCPITSAVPSRSSIRPRLSPQDSLRYTQVPADFELQLFAAEPDVVKPIFLAWDERGRAWVVEARDYPHGLVDEGELGKADIKICEDTDGDGRADKIHGVRRRTEPRDLAGLRERRCPGGGGAPHALPQGHRWRRKADVRQ